MTREEIIRMAREAGFSVTWPETVVNFERFAALVAKAEREACARVCDERAAFWPIGSDEQCEAEDCAYRIRTRGQG